jgi:hypothetical protein
MGHELELVSNAEKLVSNAEKLVSHAESHAENQRHPSADPPYHSLC